MSERRGVSRRTMLKRSLYAGLGLGLPAGIGLGGCSLRRDARRPNIVLISLDTTRVDRLGCYGYGRPTSPNLDRLASESVLYTRAIAPSSWTLPSHASLFTGKFTTSHGARYDPEGPLRLMDAIEGPDSWDRYRVRGLGAGERTLAMILRDAGYATGSIVAGPWMKRVFGLAGGFDFYDDTEISTIEGRLADSVTDSAIRWLREVGNREFFLFLNYYDPHRPLTPPRELAMKFLPPGTRLKGGKAVTPEQKRAFYDAEILYMDLHIGRLLQMLQDEGLYDDAWIIVFADHGELFGEHGRAGHGYYLFQEEIHVPLFLKYPRGERPAGSRDAWVQLTDILPLVCRRLDLAVPYGIQGVVPGEGQHPVIAETYPLPGSSGYEGDWRAIFEGDFKLLWNSQTPYRLYNLRDDPREQRDLAGRHGLLGARMLARLETYLAELPRPGDAGPERELDEETREALKSLGYVN